MTTIRFYVGIGGRFLGRRKATKIMAKHYPNGFTVQTASGSWRDTWGVDYKERVVILTACGRPDTESGGLCAGELRQALRQQSVLVTVSPETATLL